MSADRSANDAPQTAYLPTNPEAGVAVLVDEAVHPGKYDEHKGSSPVVDDSVKLAPDSTLEVDSANRRKESFWNIYRSTTFQFFIVGCLAFAGPAQVGFPSLLPRISTWLMFLGFHRVMLCMCKLHKTESS